MNIQWQHTFILELAQELSPEAFQLSVEGTLCRIHIPPKISTHNGRNQQYLSIFDSFMKPL